MHNYTTEQQLPHNTASPSYAVKADEIHMSETNAFKRKLSNLRRPAVSGGGCIVLWSCFASRWLQLRPNWVLQQDNDIRAGFETDKAG